MNEEKNHIDYLIARYIAGEASPIEAEELEQWMEQDKTNRKYFEGIRFVSQQAVASHRIEKVDVDGAWQKVHIQMKSGRNRPAEPQPAKMRILPLWIRVAAMVVLVSGLAVFFYLSSKPTPLTYPNVVAATTNAVSAYTLSDSSVVTLNRQSQIACAANYGKKERRIKLSGEAFFSVTHNQAKPFIVESNGTFIKVTGTSFDIKGNEQDSLVEVFVKTGSVLFFTSEHKGITLVAGETGVYHKNNKTFTKTVETNSNITAYTNRVFVFYNTTLNDVFRELNSVYGVVIAPASDQLGYCTITVSFNDDDIITILDVIAETLNLTYQTTGTNQFVFDGAPCNVEDKNTVK